MKHEQIQALKDALRPFAKVGAAFATPDVPLLYEEPGPQLLCFYINGESGEYLTTTHLKNAARVLAETPDEIVAVSIETGLHYDFEGVMPENRCDAWVVALRHYAQALEDHANGKAEVPDAVDLDLFAIAGELEAVLKSTRLELSRALTVLGYSNIADHPGLMPDVAAMKVVDEIRQVSQTLADAHGEWTERTLAQRLGQYIWGQNKYIMILRGNVRDMSEAMRGAAKMGFAALNGSMETHSEWRGLLRGVAQYLRDEIRPLPDQRDDDPGGIPF